MKFLNALTAIVVAGLLSASSFGAIEFSEDDAAASGLARESAVLASDLEDMKSDTGGAGIETTALPLGDASNAAVTSAQSSGTAGSTGTVSGMRGGAVMGMMGGGGGRADEDSGAAGGDEVSLNGSQAATEGLENSADGGSDSSEPVAMPEPSTAIVWSLLAACGVFAVRRRK